ncbi:MAG: DNA helicase UvrD [Candidatus Buchananbacteria bacterium RIFCSPHIGHO2_02_FULL_38_8]|uniref:DNA helicase UvrD n=1 Tax=Candidatus Buchananbacteria bacterium RIFCSPHIGHO2_02_FULL_38_8 TaxID=1797538 RepID=A0A1G1Y6N4_9BACT|nr:MAG: DNA helicase UvrD [Candidatus Buchananbacteria bacterium RIFCSPHIGHO2_02_FULL_38_8]
MRYIADLHLHSKYSRACSKDLDPPHIDQWARIKGIDIIGSADFTHPYWLKELKENLVEERQGLFKFKNSDRKVLWMLTSEVSCIYSQGGKVRRLHLCLFAPDFATVEKINQALLDRKVNLSSDGRPIMGLSAKELTKIIMDINEKNLVIPAHAWTPWFSVFGSNSGFDSLEECFGEMTKYIYSIETGLSSDPSMNWRLSILDNITLISNSDAHSPANLGREANVFEIKPNQLSYDEIRRIIKEKDKNKFLYTIEFFPEEGKYHFDGHRDCNIQLSPIETKKNKGICPVCKKPLTIGVLNRVDQLADRREGYKLNSIPYRSLVPLLEIIAEVYGQGKNTKKVDEVYHQMISKGGNEFRILLDLTKEELGKIADPAVVLGIQNVREGRINISAGYDGVFGSVKIFSPSEKIGPQQEKLF